MHIVCGIQYLLPDDGHPDPDLFGVMDIAGEYSTSMGRALDPHFTRLKTSPSHSDSQREGLRMELRGGEYLKKKQKAIIEFLCSSDGDKATEKRDDEKGEDKEDDKEDDKSHEEMDDGHGGRLKYISYDDAEGVLRLEWKTRHACEDALDSGGKSGGWGFFSWFFFM